MNILITGGAGFIASNLTQKLLTDGHQVMSLDNLLLGKREYLEPFEDNSKFEFKNQTWNQSNTFVSLFDENYTLLTLIKYTDCGSPQKLDKEYR